MLRRSLHRSRNTISRRATTAIVTEPAVPLRAIYSLRSSSRRGPAPENICFYNKHNTNFRSTSFGTVARRSLTTEQHQTHDQQLSYEVGQQVHGWDVLEVRRYEEFPDFTSYWLRHSETGAEYFHIDSPSDKNNCFSVTFKTLPQSSDGVAHILEHTTLCGSEKYPVRDLFFNMYSRSLNTFMNAWTAPDHTTYPFSTQNPKDFYNLLEVYLDASFFPNLTLEHFLQEGHRLEFDTVEDEDAVQDATGDNKAQQQQQLKIKGVVYNEMKGAMGDPSQFFFRELLRQTLPGTIYENNSGGEPRVIPDLTHDQLKQFHKTYYHPSNAKFFSYGDLPFADHLAKINEHVMSRFKGNKMDTTSPAYQIGEVNRLTEPRRVYISGPPDPMASDPNRQTKMIVSFLTNDQMDPYETFANSFLFNSLMLDEPRGPFYKNLIESGIAPDFAPGTGYDTGYKYTSYGIGAQGIAEDEVPIIEDAIQKTLEQVAREGVDPSLIETALHTIELSLKTKSPNFGISLCSLVSSVWLHMGRPSETLDVNAKLERLREEIASGDFFRSRIEKYLLNNTHRVTMVMNPDHEYARKELEIEHQKIAEIEQRLTEENRRQINEQAENLRKSQEHEPSKEILPTLTMADVSKQIPEPVHLQRNTVASDEVLINEQATNGIVYVSTQTVFEDMDKIPSELLPYIPLLTSLMARMGARDMDHTKLAEQMERFTGGISVSQVLIPRINMDGTMTDKFDLGIEMGSYCLERNVENMIDLMTAVYMDPRLVNGDLNFMKSQIDQMAISASNAIMHSGHGYARLTAASNLTYLDSISENFGGLTAVQLLNLLSMEGVSVEDVARRLSLLCRYLHQQHKMKVLITAENEDQISRTNRAMERFLDSKSSLARSIANDNVFEDSNLEGNDTKSVSFEQHNGAKTFVCIPSPVNFTSETVLTAPFMCKSSTALRVAGHLMNSKYLHKEIREKGGAYGSGASISMHGVFSFTSYRDPHIMRTINAYRNMLQWLNRSDSFTDKDLEEAKLQTFQGLDAPVTPHAKAHSEFSYGITEQMRQERRNWFYEVSRQDVLEACNRYLDPSDLSIPRTTAVLGSEDGIDQKVMNEHNKWKIIRQ